jgi:hypothetical protein
VSTIPLCGHEPMCPQNYHRESLTFCKHGGNRTLTLGASTLIYRCESPLLTINLTMRLVVIIPVRNSYRAS